MPPKSSRKAIRRTVAGFFAALGPQGTRELSRLVQEGEIDFDVEVPEEFRVVDPAVDQTILKALRRRPASR